MTDIEDPGYRYGCWAGYPKGHKQNETKCVKEISCGQRSCLFTQCSRKRGYGHNGLYCKQHAKTVASHE
jgi:hypothetical protein